LPVKSLLAINNKSFIAGPNKKVTRNWVTFAWVIETYSVAALAVAGLLSAGAGLDSFDSLFGALRTPEGDLWSVAYQPEPLKTIPTGAITLRKLFLLHSGQVVSGWSLKLW
jgi:hypothetical protein